MDWISFFEDYEIEYTTEHKHVTHGWVNINCPFCGDSNFHMGINLQYGTVHCWRCGTHSRVELLFRLSNDDPKMIMKKYSKKSSVFHIGEKERVGSVLFPNYFIPLTNIFKRYLKRRGFSPDEIELIYKVKCCLAGDYKGRLIIPFYENGEVVTWQGRAISDQVIPRYKTLSSEKSIKTPKEMLYNEPNSSEYIVVTEGVFDVWRYGNRAVSISGAEITQEQFERLLKYKVIFLALDSDTAGIKSMFEIYSRLEFYKKKVFIILLDDTVLKDSPIIRSQAIDKKIINFNYGKKDFGSLSYKEIKKVKNKIQEVYNEI